MPFIKKMPIIKHFKVVLMFKTVKNPLTVKSPSPILLPFAKVLRKLKLSKPPTRRRTFYNNAFTTTKNKSYFIKLVNKTIK